MGRHCGGSAALYGPPKTMVSFFSLASFVTIQPSVQYKAKVNTLGSFKSRLKGRSSARNRRIRRSLDALQSFHQRSFLRAVRHAAHVRLHAVQQAEEVPAMGEGVGRAC